jgi:hypothetical protein
MLRKLLPVLLLLAPWLADASPMRYELDLSPTIDSKGYGSWDHSSTVTNPAYTCAACHQRGLTDYAPSGLISTPSKSGVFLRSALKLRFYGDTANLSSYNANSTIANLQNTLTASGSYLHPGRATISVPLVSPNPLSAKQLTSGGSFFTCAVSNLGAALCWGGNTSGQLGGSSTTSPFPSVVAGLSSGISAISAGSDHTCALTTTGGVVCWGYNVFGQLGNGTTTYSTTPVQVMGLSNSVAAISAGGDYTCALTMAGGVVCWGNN